MKRTKEQNKAYKAMLKHLDDTLGEQDAGMFIAIVCDLLNKFVDGVEYRELRTMEIVLNNFYSLKYDFDKNEVVE